MHAIHTRPGAASRALPIFLLLAATLLIAAPQSRALTPDAHHAPRTTQRASRTVTYTYDAAGRLTVADYGDVAITYRYDNAGNLLQRTVTATSRQLYLPLLIKR